MKQWETTYKTHTIRVENSWNGERLYVNGELQDERVGYRSDSRLFGHIRLNDHEKEKIKVSIGAYTFSVHCRIFVNDKLVFSSER